MAVRGALRLAEVVLDDAAGDAAGAAVAIAAPAPGPAPGPATTASTDGGEDADDGAPCSAVLRVRTPSGGAAAVRGTRPLRCAVPLLALPLTARLAVLGVAVAHDVLQALCDALGLAPDACCLQRDDAGVRTTVELDAPALGLVGAALRLQPGARRQHPRPPPADH